SNASPAPHIPSEPAGTVPDPELARIWRYSDTINNIEGGSMLDVHALQDAYNDAVAKGNTKLARELLALWRDTLSLAKHSRSTSRQIGGSRRTNSAAKPGVAVSALI